MSFENIDVLSKVSLRSWAKSHGPTLTSFEHQSLLKFIKTWTKPGQTWGCFQPIQNEPPMDWSLLSDAGLNLCFPKITQDSLQFIKSESFDSGVYGVQEPVDGERIQAEDISGLFIPGLMFDNRGGRLGRGKAYYDNYLKHFSGLKVGVTWSQYFMEGSIPMEAWDVSMDFILTEKFIYQPLVSTRSCKK